MANCNSCNAQIVWARTAAGKATPMELDDNGRWFIDKDGVAIPAPLDKEINGQRYTSHFASCPQAEQWRKRASREQS